MSEIRQKREQRFGFSAQPTFGTAIADDAAFIEFAPNEPFNIDRGLTVHEVGAAYGTKYPTTAETVHTATGNMPTFTVSKPFSLYSDDHMCYSLFHKVVEGGTTPYGKTFTWFTTHPDFSANEGHFLTFVKRLPVASTSHKADSCICKRLKFSDERNGMLTLESEWVGGPSPVVNANPSGTWTMADPEGSEGYLYFNDITSVTMDFNTSPVDILLHSYEVEFLSGNIVPVGQSATGFSTFGIADLGGTFSMTVIRDDHTETALANQTTGSSVEAYIAYGGTPHLSLTWTGKIETIEDNDTDGLLSTTYSGKVLATSSVAEAATIVINNALDRAWPAA